MYSSSSQPFLIYYVIIVVFLLIVKAVPYFFTQLLYKQGNSSDRPANLLRRPCEKVVAAAYLNGTPYQLPKSCYFQPLPVPLSSLSSPSALLSSSFLVSASLSSKRVSTKYLGLRFVSRYIFQRSSPTIPIDNKSRPPINQMETMILAQPLTVFPL